mgnify:CR=1 FL=1
MVAEKFGNLFRGEGMKRLEHVLRSLRRPGVTVSTRTTIVLSTLFEKPGVLPEGAEP